MEITEIKKCLQCGAVIDVTTIRSQWQRRRAKFCNEDCYLKYHARKFIDAKCPHCGGVFRTAESHPRAYCSKRCRYDDIRNEGHKYVGGNGYYYIKDSGRYILEHRKVAAESIGRPIKRQEVVHHINGNKLDNRPENLEVIGSNSEHVAAHHREHKLRGDVHPVNRPEAIRKRVAARKRRKADSDGLLPL